MFCYKKLRYLCQSGPQLAKQIYSQLTYFPRSLKRFELIQCQHRSAVSYSRMGLLNLCANNEYLFVDCSKMGLQNRYSIMLNILTEFAVFLVKMYSRKSNHQKTRCARFIITLIQKYFWATTSMITNYLLFRSTNFLVPSIYTFLLSLIFKALLSNLHNCL